ncbi:hypothetical protein I4F81_007815 [Pyropia yezoensis]|uniref:Uncharacterized protein n=1 Tax=Pyropia yezoensis TaxID=2788 RepID=A0ACC3C530_PYRYE|nr:hypothetical protein I4F81_007815 [Neopyropia yezoensis]
MLPPWARWFAQPRPHLPPPGKRTSVVRVRGVPVHHPSTDAGPAAATDHHPGAALGNHAADTHIHQTPTHLTRLAAGGHRRRRCRAVVATRPLGARRRLGRRLGRLAGVHGGGRRHRNLPPSRELLGSGRGLSGVGEGGGGRGGRRVSHVGGRGDSRPAAVIHGCRPPHGRRPGGDPPPGGGGHRVSATADASATDVTRRHRTTGPCRGP